MKSNVLCDGNYDLPLVFECYDWDSDGSHDFIGSFKVTLNQLKQQRRFELINPAMQSKRGYKNSGELEIVLFQIDETFR